MKIFRSLITVLALFSQLSPALAYKWGGAAQPVGLTLMNVRTNAGQVFTNLAHGISLSSSSSSNWAGALTSAGYPTSTSPSFTSNNLSLIPNYYGHYKIWWSNTGAIQIQWPMVIYSGGTSTALNTASGSGNSLALGYNGSSTQPTSGSPIEFAIGAFVNAISDAGTGACATAGGTSGLVCLTGSIAGIFGNFVSGGTVKVNNITNLPSQVWTFTLLDSSHIQLQGSTFSAGMSINSGSAGTQSEAIFSVSSATWVFPAQGTLSAAYSSFGGMVICRSQNTGYANHDDCTNIVNGTTGQYANIDYTSLFKKANPRFARFMDLSQVITGNGSTSTNYTYRPITTNLSWSSNEVAAYLGGALTNTSDAFTVANPSASPGSGAYQDGEVVIGQVGASGANTTYAPTLQISSRTGAVVAPILSPSGSQKNVTISGTLPLSSSTVTMAFSGGGLASSHNVLYTVQSSDTSQGALCAHLVAAINADTTISAAGIAAQNYDYAFPQGGFPASAGQCSSTKAAFTLYFNPNINSSGVAALGNGMTLSVSDNSGQGTTYGVGALYPGALANSQYYSFTWSTQFQAWIANSLGTTSWGMNDGPPLEFYEDFCLQANIGLWLNVGMFWNQTYITNAVTNIANSGVKELAIEYGNEVWNNGNYNWAQANHLGLTVGLTSDTENSWYGLRVALISQAAKTAWTNAGRPASALHIVNAYQFVALSQTNRWNGGDLNPGSNVTLAAYGNWGATTLSTNYSASPNRPIDLSDLASPATYWAGAQLNITNSGGLNGGTLTNYNGLMLAGYNYAYGTAALQTAALNFLYNVSSGRGDLYDGYDAYAGSVSSLATCDHLPSYWANGSGQTCAGYYGIASTVSAYDAGRASASLPVLGIAAYEGDFQAGPVTSGQQSQIVSSLNGLGYTAGTNSPSTLAGAAAGATCASSCPTGGSDTSTLAAQNIANLLLAFKQTSAFQSLYTKQLTDERAAYLASGNRIALAGVYGLEVMDVWGKFNGSNIYATEFQSMPAICALSSSSC